MYQYLNLLRAIRETGGPHEDRTGVGTLSLFGRQLRHNMQIGFPLLTTKKVLLRWVFEELRWILSGDTDERNLRAKGVDIWKEWADKETCAKFGRDEGDLGPVYGWQLRHFGASYVPISNHRRNTIVHALGFDQLWYLCYNLEHDPYSRRHVVSYWNPEQVALVSLPPCHTLWQCKVTIDDSRRFRPELHLELFARSIDSFLGLPFNIASYGLLLTMLAWACNYEVGELIISFGDVHIYRNHFAQVDEQLQRTPRPLSKVSITRRWVREHGAFTNLMSVRWEDISLEGYDPWPKIEAEVAI